MELKALAPTRKNNPLAFKNSPLDLHFNLIHLGKGMLHPYLSSPVPVVKQQD